jgi:hypothetical protein
MNLSIVLPAISAPAFAYIGPGIGAGVVSIVLGFGASIFLAIFAVIWYPLKRLFRRRKKMRLVAEPADES